MGNTGTGPLSASEDTIAHAADGYRAAANRQGLSLCLSGGGYRAALFHLGALTRLNELGVLSQVDTFSSVSGGSILAAHLATQVNDWPERGKPVGDWTARVMDSFLNFTHHNIRNGPLAKRYLVPWNWLRGRAAVDALESAYAKHLTTLDLSALPVTPRFIMSATDMVFGVNWVFDSGRERMGDYLAGYTTGLTGWPLARVVAASSCFPPVFDPLPIDPDPETLTGGSYRKDDRDALVRKISLSDGGVYDNLGLEPVWKNHAIVLVSDGGAVFEAEKDSGFIWRLNRYASVAGRQGSAMRKRWLISNFDTGEFTGTYWSVGSITTNYDKAAVGYPRWLVDERIEEVRTDLDRFAEAEQQVLINHGYLLTDAAIQRHTAQLISIAAPLDVPYPGDAMDPAWVKKQLAHSSRHRIWRF